MRFRSPRLEELAELTELCLRSKAVWGYDEDFIEACRPELTLTDADVGSPLAQVAEDSGHPVGVAQISLAGNVAYLEKLFVAPGRIRARIGEALFRWAATTARSHGAGTLIIESDPDALDFYRRMGAIDDGTAPSGAIPGRVLPRLTLTL